MLRYPTHTSGTSITLKCIMKNVDSTPLRNHLHSWLQLIWHVVWCFQPWFLSAAPLTSRDTENNLMEANMVSNFINKSCYIRNHEELGKYTRCMFGVSYFLSDRFKSVSWDCKESWWKCCRWQWKPLWTLSGGKGTAFIYSSSQELHRPRTCF